MQGYFRQFVTDSLEIGDSMIDGEKIVVEIDEIKLEKWKYHREHHIYDVLVIEGFGCIKEKSDSIQVDERTTEQFNYVIINHIN